MFRVKKKLEISGCCKGFKIIIKQISIGPRLQEIKKKLIIFKTDEIVSENITFLIEI